MKPITQTRTGYGRGNCTEAALASILEVELATLPELWAGPHVPFDAPPDMHQPTERCEALWRHLREVHSVVWCEMRFPRRLQLSEVDAYTVVSAYQAVLGPAPATLEHHVMFGPNPGGVSHCVVGRMGAVVWDPNPSRAGLAAVDGLIFLVPLALCPPDLPLAAAWHLQLGEAP